MIAAVLELRDFERDGFCRIAHLLFGNVVDFRTRFHVSYDFIFKRACDVGIAPKPVVNRRLHFFHNRQADFNVAEFVFRLAREHRIIKPDFHRRKQAACNVALVIVFFEKLVDALRKTVEKSGNVRTPVFRALSVDE